MSADLGAAAEIATRVHYLLATLTALDPGPGGRQILIADPAGNLIELFQPAESRAATPARSAAGIGAADDHAPAQQE